ncbi:hypothetical protein EPUL_001117 [Erysiphe pulchra]|uniref:Reverse transcriptase Ty1/copia-type domain-containing protein n=1 Tax=Erysiphe pulchra TaxID=225359 RepID=A0A2S4PY66_9PEZI|nr:hypothetical protein EPUL_001117 [Erysiphe pulchra]
MEFIIAAKEKSNGMFEDHELEEIDTQNPTITPVFQDRFVDVEHGNPMNQLLEDVIEESLTTQNQVNNISRRTTNSLPESTEKLQTDFSENLPTPRATPEVLNEQTISRETSHGRIEESVENMCTPSLERNTEPMSNPNKRPYNRKLTEEQVLDRLREKSRETRARRRNERKINLNFYTEVSDIDSVPTDDLFETIYSSFAISQNRRLHIDQLQKPPSRWETMLKHPEASGFISAANLEIQSQESKGTWIEVTRPANFKVLSLKWAFTYKLDDQGYLRALYGLRVSPKLWFDGFLATIGFKYSPEDHCIMIHESLTILIFIYVDDFLIAAPTYLRAHMDQIKLSIDAKYELCDLGEVKRFLNLDICRNREKCTIHISMASYIDKIVTRFHLQHVRLPNVPLTGKKLLPYDGVVTPEKRTAYQQRIGDLIYPDVVLRPDISFAAAMLSRFNQNPTPDHIREADHVIYYLAATKHVGIRYSGNVQPEDLMVAASDASFSDDSTRKSTQGFLIKLFGGQIVWQSTLQRTIVLSTTEAEIMALTSVGREIMSIRRLFKSIRFDPDCNSPLLCDNNRK